MKSSAQDLLKTPKSLKIDLVTAENHPSEKKEYIFYFLAFILLKK